MKKELTIKIPSDFVFVRGVRVCVARIAHDFGFNEKELYQIETIVDELCNNAIEHGCETTGQFVRIKCSFSADEVCLKVMDKGTKNISIANILKKNTNRLKREIKRGALTKGKRGRGLIIVNKFADKISVKKYKNGLEVTAVKRKGRD